MAKSSLPLLFAVLVGLCGCATHHDRIAPVREAFTPSAAQQDWAHRVLAAEASAGGGAFTVDGKMVDPPVLKLARQILSQA